MRCPWNSSNCCWLRVSLLKELWYVIFCFKIVVAMFQGKHTLSYYKQKKENRKLLVSAYWVFLSEEFLSDVGRITQVCPAFTRCLLIFWESPSVISWEAELLWTALTLSCKLYFPYMHQCIWHWTNTSAIQKIFWQEFFLKADQRIDRYFGRNNLLNLIRLLCVLLHILASLYVKRITFSEWVYRC